VDGTGQRTQHDRAGDRIEPGVDARSLPLFDPGSGLARASSTPRREELTMTVTQSPQQDSMGTLTDKVALVTGGTRGIGAAIGRGIAPPGGSGRAPAAPQRDVDHALTTCSRSDRYGKPQLSCWEGCPASDGAASTLPAGAGHHAGPVSSIHRIR
jgi:hypothetical protein